MIEFEREEKRDVSHMIMAFALALVLLFALQLALGGGFDKAAFSLLDWIAFASVLALAVVSLVCSAYMQLRFNGSQSTHHLPVSCLLFGLLLLDCGVHLGIPEGFCMTLSAILCGLGCIGYVGGRYNKVFILSEVAAFVVFSIARGLSDGRLFCILSLAFLAFGLVFDLIHGCGAVRFSAGIVLGFLLGLSMFMTVNLYVWTALVGCIFAWLSNHAKPFVTLRPEKEVPQEKPSEEISESEISEILSEPEKAPESPAVKSETPQAPASLAVRAEVSSWMQGFANAASLVESEGVSLFAYNANSNIYYRYSRQSRELVQCTGGLKPDLPSLVEKSDRPLFMGFLAKASCGEADSVFHCRIWDEDRMGYFDNSIKATVIEMSGPVLAIFATEIDSYTLKYRKEVSALQGSLEESRQQYSEVVSESKRVFYACNELLNSFIEKKSEESYSHNHVVCRLAEILMRKAMVMDPEFGIDEAMIQRIKDATILHDVGKIMVPDNILKKQGRFTPEEAEIMKLHSRYGAEIINRMPYVRGEEQTMKYALDIALHHHERVDGKGYPSGLCGDKIPFYVQIVALADVYEALTARRVYKEPVSHEKALEMIRGGECGTFSPWIMKLLDQVQEDFAMVRSELNY